MGAKPFAKRVSIPWTLRESSSTRPGPVCQTLPLPQSWSPWKLNILPDGKMADEGPFCGPSDGGNDDKPWDFGKSRHHLNSAEEFEGSKAHRWFWLHFSVPLPRCVWNNISIPSLEATWPSQGHITVTFCPSGDEICISGQNLFQIPKKSPSAGHTFATNGTSKMLGTRLCSWNPQFCGCTFVSRGLTLEQSDLAICIHQSKVPVIVFPMSDRNSFFQVCLPEDKVSYGGFP